MAENRSKYQDILRNLQKQIIQNWCLVRYCTITNTNMDLRSHWCSELIGYLYDICEIKLKDDKTYKIKLKATKQQYLEYSELDTDKDKIWIGIKQKFDKEHITDKNIIDRVIEDFMNDIENICEMISSKPTQTLLDNINKYVYNEI